MDKAKLRHYQDSVRIFNEPLARVDPDIIANLKLSNKTRAIYKNNLSMRPRGTVSVIVKESAEPAATGLKYQGG